MILSVQNVSKSFGTDEILKNVSFHIEDHEKAAVVGINGAGKSTLLNTLTGAGILAEDKLFATLDPTPERLSLQKVNP